MNNFLLEQYLNDYEVGFKIKEEKDCKKYELKRCVFDSSHTNNDACIFEYNDNGIIVYKCQHNSCNGYKWMDAKKKISGRDFLTKYWNSKEPPMGAPKSNNREDIGYIDFKKILDTDIEINPIIEGFLYEGDQTIIHAAGGVGKSLLTLYLSLCLGSADEPDSFKELWQGFSIPKSRRVLFLQAENNQANMHKRLNYMCDGIEVFEAGVKNLFTAYQHNDVILTGNSFSDPEFCQWLIDFIKKIESERNIKLDILVIDPLISFYDGDENDARKARAVLDGVTDVCLQTQTTPIVIHHANKNGTFRGSSAIRDWARNMIQLKETTTKVENAVGPSEDIQSIGVIHEKCNNHQPFKPFFLQIDENLNFKVIHETKNLPEKSAEKYKAVAKALENMGGEAESKNALAKAYSEESGVGLTAARMHVTQAAENDFIKCIKNGKGNKQPFKYVTV